MPRRNHQQRPDRHKSGPSESGEEVERHEEEEKLMRVWGEEHFHRLMKDPKPTQPISRANIKARIATLEQQVKELQKQRRLPHTTELIEKIARLRAEKSLLCFWLFPINNLPVELLRRIFMLITLSQPILGIPTTRIRLGGVCRYWWSVIVGMSRLWAIIPVREQFPFPLLRMSLRLAQRQLLTLCIDQRKPDWNGSESDHRMQPRDMQALMMNVAKILPQVRELAILADTWEVIVAAVQVLGRVPPPRSLQRLEIRRTGGAYVTIPNHIVTPPQRLFGGAQAPMLSHIAFAGVNIDFQSSPFRNLRVLEMRKVATEHMPAAKDFFPVLQGSPLLEKLIFNSGGPKTPKPDELHAWEDVEIRLAHLRELTIANMSSSYALFLVELLHAPFLKRLTLKALYKHNGDFTDFIAALTNGRFPRVTELTVNGLACDDYETIWDWIRTTRVQHLKVGNVSDQFYMALAYRLPYGVRGPGHGLSVCPYLHTCEILSWSGREFGAIRTFCTQKSDSLRSLLIGDDVWKLIDENQRSWLSSTPFLTRIPNSYRAPAVYEYEY